MQSNVPNKKTIFQTLINETIKLRQEIQKKRRRKINMDCKPANRRRRRRSKVKILLENKKKTATKGHRRI